MISFLLVFPLTQSMTGAFQRRERGITSLQNFKSNVLSLMLAHKDWDWPVMNAKDPKEPPSGGRAPRLAKDHISRVVDKLTQILNQVEILLLAPTTSIMMFLLSTKDIDIVRLKSREVRKSIIVLFRDLSLFTEELKASGLPANEATRIRQYFTAIIDSYNQLISIKQYHTPLGLRAFTRLFILLLPWLFGPYLGNLAASTGLAFAVTFSGKQTHVSESFIFLLTSRVSSGPILRPSRWVKNFSLHHYNPLPLAPRIQRCLYLFLKCHTVELLLRPGFPLLLL